MSAAKVDLKLKFNIHCNLLIRKVFYRVFIIIIIIKTPKRRQRRKRT